MTLRISIPRVASFLGLGIAFLTLVGGAVFFSIHVLERRRLLGLVQLFDIARDSSIPTWWSSVMLLFCVLLLGTIASETARRGGADRRYWWGLAMIFLGLSIDEVARIHEVLGGTAGNKVKAALNLTSPFFLYSWVIIGFLFVAIFAVVFFRFYLRLPRRSKLGFGAAGVLFIGGAIGFESLTARYLKLHAYDQEAGIYTYDFTVSMITLAEEFLEMVGVAVFACALISHLKSMYHGSDLVIQIGPDPVAGVERGDMRRPDPVAQSVV